MIREIRKRPFIRLLSFWIFGILIQYYFPQFQPCSYTLLLVGCILFGYNSYLNHKKKYANRWLWGTAYGLLLIFFAIQYTYIQQNNREWHLPTQYLTAKVTIDETARHSMNSNYCRATLHRIILKDHEINTHKQVQLYLSKAISVDSILPGRELTIQGEFKKSNSRWLTDKGIAATAYINPKNLIIHTDTLNLSYKQQALRWQQKLTHKIKGLSIPIQNQAILAAINLGDTSMLTTELRNSFSSTGVAHILAVSGFHVGIIALLMASLLKVLYLGKYSLTIQSGVIVIFIWVFAYITGLSAPTVRASIMLSLFMLGNLLSKQPDKYNTVASTAFFMLLYQPFYLFDLGFQLSFLALTSILYFYPRLYSWIKVRNPIIAAPWGWICISLAAQIGTIPLCLYTFQSVSGLFIFTTIPITLLASLLIPLTFIWLAIESIFPLLEQFIIGAITYCTEWILQIISLFNNIPIMMLNRSLKIEETLLSYLSIILIACFIKNKQPRLLLASLLSIFCILIVNLFSL